MTRVKEYMTTTVLTIDEHESAADAAKVMAEDAQAQGYVLVLAKGRPTGIVTEGDLLRHILATGTTRRIGLSEIMSTPLITVELDAALVAASELMRAHNVRKLPVVSAGIVYGMITADAIATNIGRNVV